MHTAMYFGLPNLIQIPELAVDSKLDTRITVTESWALEKLGTYSHSALKIVKKMT